MSKEAEAILSGDDLPAPTSQRKPEKDLIEAMSQSERDQLRDSILESVELGHFEGRGADGPLYAADYFPHGEIIELTINDVRINFYDPALFATFAKMVSDSVKELRKHVKTVRAKPANYRSLG